MGTRYEQADLTAPTSLNIGLVTSRFNSEVTEKLEAGALRRLEALKVKSSQVLQIRVPGAFELPLAAQWLFESGCDGVIALGAVIRGETTHYDYVCQAVERGCSELQLGYGKPVAFGVLTTENLDQALARCGGDKGHKGEEAVDVLIEMLNLKKLIREQ